tara:strand:+ start:1998 stop:2339 length:342 start_codon:yes stop_codon:yes gene_type:complete
MADIDSSGNLAETQGLDIDKVFERTNKHINDMGFSQMTLKRRVLEMKELEKAYPKMPTAWLEMAWNFHEMTPKEEQDKIIKEGLWDEPPDVIRQLGGLMKNSITVETPLPAIE